MLCLPCGVSAARLLSDLLCVSAARLSSDLPCDSVPQPTVFSDDVDGSVPIPR